MKEAKMEYVILGLLIIQPSTLYSLNKSFEQGISLFFSPSLGSINSAIKRLIEKGFIKQEDTIENGRVKKILTITKLGQENFLTWMYTPLEPKNLEVNFLSRLYFLGLIPSSFEQIELLKGMYQTVLSAKETLDQTAEALEEIDIPDAYKNIFFYQKKTLQYGIDSHAFALQWINDLIGEKHQQSTI